MECYNVFSCHKVVARPLNHKSTHEHDKLVKNKVKDLLKYGTCFCFNPEQRDDIIEQANVKVTVTNGDIIYIFREE